MHGRAIDASQSARVTPSFRQPHDARWVARPQVGTDAHSSFLATAILWGQGPPSLEAIWAQTHSAATTWLVSSGLPLPSVIVSGTVTGSGPLRSAGRDIFNHDRDGASIAPFGSS